MMALCCSAHAQDFSAVTSTGQTLYYTITDVDSVKVVAPSGWVGYTKPTGSLQIPDLVTHQGNYYTVKEIDYRAFYECAGLTSVTLSNTIRKIGDYAFARCYGMTSIHVPFNYVTHIGRGAFQECTSLTSFTVPSYVQSVSRDLFRGCTSLTDVTFHTQVFSIGMCAFAGCTALQDMVMPHPINNVADSAFADCTNLRRVFVGGVFQDESDYYGLYMSSIFSNAFAGCTSLQFFEMKGELPTTFYQGAFRNCERLRKVTFPQNTRNLLARAFINCSSLDTLDLPASLGPRSGDVPTIGDECFKNCSGVRAIISRSATPPIMGQNAFLGVDSNVTVYIPCNTTAAYASSWTHFHNFSEFFYQFTAESFDTTQGTAVVLNDPTCDAPDAIVQALPKEGFRFWQWSDGSTDNPHTVTVTGDGSLTAFFAVAPPPDTTDTTNTAIATVVASSPNVYADGRRIVVEDCAGETVRLYDITGRLLATKENALSPATFELPAAGPYLVRVGNQELRKVIVQ